MSQMHKNRIVAKKEAVRKRQNKINLARWDQRHEFGMRMTKSAERNPELNPSGSAKFDYLLDPITAGPSGVIAIPSASHAARIRGNKARGTQSSATRVQVK